MFSSSMGANDFKPLHVEQNSPGAFHVLFKSLQAGKIENGKWDTIQHDKPYTKPS